MKSNCRPPDIYAQNPLSKATLDPVQLKCQLTENPDVFDEFEGRDIFESIKNRLPGPEVSHGSGGQALHAAVLAEMDERINKFEYPPIEDYLVKDEAKWFYEYAWEPFVHGSEAEKVLLIDTTHAPAINPRRFLQAAGCVTRRDNVRWIFPSFLLSSSTSRSNNRPHCWDQENVEAIAVAVSKLARCDVLIIADIYKLCQVNIDVRYHPYRFRQGLLRALICLFTAAAKVAKRVVVVPGPQVTDCLEKLYNVGVKDGKDLPMMYVHKLQDSCYPSARRLWWWYDEILKTDPVFHAYRQ